MVPWFHGSDARRLSVYSTAVNFFRVFRCCPAYWYACCSSTAPLRLSRLPLPRSCRLTPTSCLARKKRRNNRTALLHYYLLIMEAARLPAQPRAWPDQTCTTYYLYTTGTPWRLPATPTLSLSLSTNPLSLTRLSRGRNIQLPPLRPSPRHDMHLGTDAKYQPVAPGPNAPGALLPTHAG
jgi:hypothetical protein